MNTGCAGWFPRPLDLDQTAAASLSAIMPFYFAYGANLDRAGMARRCPASVAIGPAFIEGWRFVIMAAGYATMLPCPGAVVHGLLWTMADADWPALDAYEEVEAGLYRRTALPVVHAGASRYAAVYVAASTTIGVARPGYMEAVLAAAEACGLPADYRADLRRWLGAP